MPPKIQFTREQIIEAAFQIASEDGLHGITIRKVAQALGSSIAPIYVNFAHVDELLQAVVQRAFEAGRQLLVEEDTGNPYFDIGAASLRFAREYSPLFRDLVLNPNPYMSDYDQDMGSALLELMKKDPELAGYSDEELRTILLKGRIFQLGLSVMVANGLLPADFNEERTRQLLESAGADAIIAARIRKQQPK
jgi:AcrR family transcriptional regulator